MWIREIRLEREGDRVRSAARVGWEDCDRPEQTIFFQASGAHGEALRPAADAFLVGSFVPAMRAGERRIAIEGSICPRLRDGVVTAMDTLSRWYGAPRTQPRIEATVPDAVQRPVTPPRAGLLLSGGVDSLFLLSLNQRCFPPDHPARFRDGIYLEGADIGASPGKDPEQIFRAARACLEPVAAETGLELIPLRTNLKALDWRIEVYIFESMGSVLAAAAHALGARLSDVSIAATHHVRDLRPHGSHPHLVHCYQSSSVRVHHENQAQLRTEKVADLAGWDTALAHLRVCFHYGAQSDGVNCGRCSKCVRTMLELVVAGADPSRVATLPMEDLTPRMVRRLRIGGWNESVYLTALVEPLGRVGRQELADALAVALRRGRRAQRLRRLVHRRGPESAGS